MEKLDKSEARDSNYTHLYGLGSRVEVCLELIEEYRRLEKSQYIYANETIESMFLREEKWKIKHIQDQWKYKKKDFGAWYLNLDVRNRIAFINYFGIFGMDDSFYLAKTKENPRSALFLEPPVLYSEFKKLLVFFNNHGISAKPTHWLDLNKTPKFGGKSFDEKDPCYGNTKNWGNYILSLPEDEQKSVVQRILDNYTG